MIQNSLFDEYCFEMINSILEGFISISYDPFRNYYDI